MSTSPPRNLVDSMTIEVIVRDHSIEAVVPGATIGYEEAVRLALADRAVGTPTAQTDRSERPDRDR